MEKQVLNPSRSLEIHIKSDNKNQLFKDSNIMKREDIFKSVLSWEIDRITLLCSRVTLQAPEDEEDVLPMLSWRGKPSIFKPDFMPPAVWPMNVGFLP